MHLYPQEHILSGPYKVFKFEPELISEVLSFLRPDNMIMIVSAKDVETNQEEKWYGTKYSLQPVDSALLETWSNASIDTEWMTPKLALLERNDTDFEL